MELIFHNLRLSEIDNIKRHKELIYELLLHM